jgi:hypothetical protein
MEHKHKYKPIAYFYGVAVKDEWLILECENCNCPKKLIIIQGISVRNKNE